MSLPKVFIDGHAGTTGLRIREYLRGRRDLRLLTIADPDRKDPVARTAQMNEADLVILCLPDEAALEAVALLENDTTKVVDASTAHRIHPDWVFGLPELDDQQRARIAGATRVSNPGCYPQTVILALRPLLDAGLLPRSSPITVHALSGYTGGGKSLIDRWEDPDAKLLSLVYEAPYAMDRVHKHVAEMHVNTGLEAAPMFVPAVGPFATGMRVQIPLHASMLSPGTTAEHVQTTLAARYRDEPFIRVMPLRTTALGERDLDPSTVDGTNMIELHVLANPAGHILLVGLLDNLGKGAGGSAVQNLNLMLGLDESAGLRVSA